MAWFACLGASGSGDTQPTFTSSTLATNSGASATITLSDDYHNYDILEFTLTNSSQENTKIITIPNVLDAILDITTYINFDEFHTSQYGAYSYDSSTRTFTKKTSGGPANITLVKGYICSNKTATTTDIFTASARSSTAVAVAISGSGASSFYDYDVLFFAFNSSTNDELGPCRYACYPKTYFEDDIGFAFNFYNNEKAISIGEYALSEARYTYVGGIKFT